MYEAGNIPQPYERYRHFKGNIYQILNIATHSESGEEMVVYQALYGDYKVYVRPLVMFMSEVDHIKYPDVAQKYRFERISIVNEGVNQSGNEGTINQSGNESTINQSGNEGTINQSGNEGNDQTGNEAYVLPPEVERFLDAASYEERLEILEGMKDNITDDMIDIMSTTIDVAVEEGRIQKRYERLKDAVRTRMQYETHRLR